MQINPMMSKIKHTVTLFCSFLLPQKQLSQARL